jgi:hypothetical protein
MNAPTHSPILSAAKSGKWQEQIEMKTDKDFWIEKTTAALNQMRESELHQLEAMFNAGGGARFVLRIEQTESGLGSSSATVESFDGRRVKNILGEPGGKV